MQSPDWPNASHFSNLLGMQLDRRSDGEAEVSLTVEPRHANTVGIAHGGILTSVMDTACGAAVAYQPSIGGKGVTTVSIQVTYLAPTFVGDVVTATATRRGAGRRILTLAVEAKNQRGEPLAIGLCTLRVRSGAEPLRPHAPSDKT